MLTWQRFEIEIVCLQLAVDEKRGKSQLMLLYEEITKEELAKQHRKEHKKQKRKKKKEKKHELEEKENSCEVSELLHFLADHRLVNEVQI